MKTSNNLSKKLFGGVSAVFLGMLSISTAHAQIFVTNYLSGTIGEYDATTGAAINASLLSGLNYPAAISISGTHLFVGMGDGTIGEYTTSGATVNASLVSGIGYCTGIAISGSNLYVEDAAHGTIGEYNATTGAAINTSLVSFESGVYGFTNFAISGSNLYVLNANDGTVAEYNAITGAAINTSFISTGWTSTASTGAKRTVDAIAISGSNLYVEASDIFNNYNAIIGEYNAATGAAINTSLVSGLGDGNGGLAVSGENLYVTNTINNSIGEYDASTGAAINTSLVSSGLSEPSGIAVEAAPEPSTWALLLGGLGLLGFIHRRKLNV